MAEFRATFGESEQLQASFVDSQSMGADFGEVIEVERHVDMYDGPYEITPKAYDPQTLETEGKKMRGNMIVLQVPYWETENLFHGNTVYIANE